MVDMNEHVISSSQEVTYHNLDIVDCAGMYVYWFLEFLVFNINYVKKYTNGCVKRGSLGNIVAQLVPIPTHN